MSFSDWLAGGVIEVVSFLAFHLWDPGLTPTGALCGLGSQSLPNCVGFPLNNSLGFPSTSKAEMFQHFLLVINKGLYTPTRRAFHQ